MKINEVTIYKLEATDTEVENIYYLIEGPYYRIDSKWYYTEPNRNRIYPLGNGEEYLPEKLETNFQDMMPFKGQLELF